MSNKKLHIILGRLLLCLLVAGSVVLLLGAVRSKGDKVCDGLDIQIGLTDHKGFVDEKEVKRIIGNEMNTKVKGTSISKFNLGSMESVLEKNVWIKKAQLFFDNNELLHVKIEQRIPLLRIIDNSGAAYYLDSTGFSMPLSITERADVPVFTGVPVKRSSKLQRIIIGMATHIINDSFWLAQASQINLLPKDRFELYPAFGNHVVDLGDGLNPKDKFDRLKIFYKNVSAKEGFDVYTTLSVAYSGQIVAVRGNTIAPQVDTGKAMQVFEQMVKTNRRTANMEKSNNYDDKKIVNHTELIERATHSNDVSPDSNHKGNPAIDNGKNKIGDTAKAVMPKFNHN